MRNFGLALLALAGAIAASVGASAQPLQPAVMSSADPAPMLEPVRTIRVHVYTCTARSRFAYGVWTSTSLALAQHNALVQCAIRTPRGYLCVITHCR
ncbi:MAG: hypothetical protein ACHP84_01645 [Caulobacterales bacterium]